MSKVVKTNSLNLYSVFHLNMAYSSIEVEQRAEVIEKCYWPLLRIAREHEIPLGIEATGFTLESIASIDPVWLEELQILLTKGTCEFIGSGYAQIIGPLVPAQVNSANQQLGNQVYLELLGFQPQIALINEQAYSAGLIEHYLDAGYKAIIMEWDNPARFHPEWDQEWRYLPQLACGQNGEEIPILWNKSIAFQKFQRYAHGELELIEYIRYLESHLSNKTTSLSLYGNDVEVFDFRPGRYHTEAVLVNESEWTKIENLFLTLRRDDRFNLVGPSEALNLLKVPGADNRLSLESPEHPTPVKKQGKYNITRWAVTGRDDIGINTACYRIYTRLKDDPRTSDEDWKELCYLWSSDFRTHITEKRWKAYLERLKIFSKKWANTGSEKTYLEKSSGLLNISSPIIREEGRFLYIETDNISLSLNRSRGLTVDYLHFKDAIPIPQVVTLPHGYFDDISLGADWYSGHLVQEVPGQPKVTDLNPTEPEVDQVEQAVNITGIIDTLLGPVGKTITVSLLEPSVTIRYLLKWESVPIGSLRFGHITLNPEAFEHQSLFYRTCNGGYNAETFPLSGRKVNHGSPVSFQISAESGTGMTEGWIEIGDGNSRIRMESEMSQLAVIGMVSYREIGDKYFCRIFFSAGELDETKRDYPSIHDGFTMTFKIAYQDAMTTKI